MAPRERAHPTKMNQRFISIRIKLLFMLGCFLFGLLSVISLDFYFDGLRQGMELQHQELLAQGAHADKILSVVNRMQINLYKVVYQNKVELQSKILVGNENLLSEFEEFRMASQQAELDEDYFFLLENETALLRLRANIFRVVALLRAGEQKHAIQVIVQKVDPGVFHIKTFIENAGEIRRLRVLDHYKLKKDLDNRRRLLEVVVSLSFLLVGLVIALTIARSIVKPIEALTKQILGMKPGVTHPSFRPTGGMNDEAAILTKAFKELIDAYENATKSTLENERFAQNLLNSTGEGIYGIGLNGECSFINSTCLEVLGYQSEEELLGKNMHVLIHHTHKDGTPYPIEDSKIIQSYQSGQDCHVDDEVLWRMDGTSFHAEYRSAPIRLEGEIVGSVVTFTNIEKRIKAEIVQTRSLMLNKKTIAATTAFLKGENPIDVFENILDNILELTQSEYGFIGDVLYDQSGAPYLKSKAITNIAWDQASRDLYRPEGMEFRNLDTLFGHVMTTKRCVISNSPADDERAGGIPEGHPPMTSFLGIPLMRGEDIIGMLGIANRAGGYDDTVFNFIEPFANVCAYILWGVQLNEENASIKERLLSFFNVSQEGILFHDQGIITDVNTKATELTGYGHDEMVGQSVLEFVAPESKQMIAQNIVIKSAVPHEFEVISQRKDGSKFNTEVLSDDIKVQGRQQRVVSFRDITKRKTLESEFIQVATELIQLIDTANAPIFGVNTELQVNEWNKAVEKITGFSKDEVMGCSFIHQFIEDTDQKSVTDILTAGLEGRETAYFELNLKTRSGADAIVRFNTTTRRDMNDHITGVISIGQDITEQRQKEDALNQAQKMEAVGQLTGGIAHDFNNLLSVISGNLRFLREDFSESSVEINELFEDAMSAVDDGAELTRRLLSFSRNRQLRPVIKNIGHLIDDFSRFLSRTLGAGVRLDIDVPDTSLFINVDLSQLENALLNLSLNARDALPNGGTITIRVTQYHHGDGDGDGDGYSLALAPGNYIKISVIDEGTGISSEDLLHVYEPFFTTKDIGKGSGLGLSMVYGFTKQSNGACYIDSTPGEGTTVSMYFHEVMEDKAIEISNREDTSSFPGSEVILVVEDEPRVRRVTLRDLKNLGYQTLEAENAAVAKTIIESGEHIDLLFSDILMPGEMDGYKLGVWTEKYYPEIKVILTSGYTKNKAASCGVEESPFPLVRKPYVINKLAKQIRTTLTEVEGLSV